MADRQAIESAFKLFDKDNSGHITVDELETAMKNLGQEPTKFELQMLIKDADSDDSGTISLEEFVKYMSTPPKGRISAQQLKEQFKVFDKNGDGKISKDEMHSVMGGLDLGDFPREVVDQIFDECDADGDGKINFQEFVNNMV